MATVRKEFRSARSADEVWAVLRKFEAVHEMAPGFVTATKMEPSGARPGDVRERHGGARVAGELER
ncbi:MAG: SRPBCC family protein [Alphaproteobacteria bacterium]|nr:SRPBCC family protein [Alphaproteobacteria bacterium]